MANTEGILAQLKEIDNIVQTTHVVPQSQPAISQVKRCEALGPGAEAQQSGTYTLYRTAFPETTDCVAGVAYATSISQGLERDWIIRGARTSGRAGCFVYERPDRAGGHEYMKPAILSSMFQVPYTILEAGDTENWRNDLPASGIPAVFPNLDIILANVHGSPEDFVRSFVDQGWATTSRAIGPLAHLVQQHIASPSIQQKLNENGLTKCVLLFDVLLSFAKFGNGRKGDTLWMGCPVFPNQLLAVLQRQVAIETGSAWQMPADDQTVKLLGVYKMRKNRTPMVELCSSQLVRNHTRVARLSEIARYQGARRPGGQGSLYRGTAVFACARYW